MSTEAIAITGILILCWTVLVIADAMASGVLAVLTSLTFKQAFLKGLLVLLIPPVFIAYGAWIGRERPQVKEVELEFQNLPEGFDGYRLIHISDIHARSFSKRHDSLKKIIEIINGLDPDMVAFTGDLITLDSSEIDVVKDILQDIRATDGVVSVLGNHDYCIYSAERDKTGHHPKGPSEVIRKEKEMGWNILLDENMTVTRGRDSIKIIGVENISPSGHFPSKGNLQKASAGTEGSFRIILTHDPMHWESEITGKEYPLTLSGHTHAMQFSLFGWSPSRYIFRQNRGLYSQGSQYIYVNPGLGETIIPVRIGVRPEITVITLKKSS